MDDHHMNALVEWSYSTRLLIKDGDEYLITSVCCYIKKNTLYRLLVVMTGTNLLTGSHDRYLLTDSHSNKSCLQQACYYSINICMCLYCRGISSYLASYSIVFELSSPLLATGLFVLFPMSDLMQVTRYIQYTGQEGRRCLLEHDDVNDIYDQI